MSDVPQVEPDDAHTMLEAGGLLLDVREQDEWDAGHVPDAQFIPLGEVGARFGEIPRDRRIVVICRSGARSDRAAQFLASQGFDAVNVSGGMRAWVTGGYDDEVVATDGLPGTVI
ncbi:MAG TPA: rhodanese-like domain-containing protein [Acidimicrobiia bacterium]|jgi:rhodanese-related sulfurtransferase|nr:rhodanese-like domain-containing protein [Acidimicrobiia bacterium]